MTARGPMRAQLGKKPLYSASTPSDRTDYKVPNTHTSMHLVQQKKKQAQQSEANVKERKDTHMYTHAHMHTQSRWERERETNNKEQAPQGKNRYNEWLAHLDEAIDHPSVQQPFASCTHRLAHHPTLYN